MSEYSLINSFEIPSYTFLSTKDLPYEASKRSAYCISSYVCSWNVFQRSTAMYVVAVCVSQYDQK